MQLPSGNRQSPIANSLAKPNHIIETRVRAGSYNPRLMPDSDLLIDLNPSLTRRHLGRCPSMRIGRSGAAIHRTDLDGQVTIETDGTNVRVRTYVEGTR